MAKARASRASASPNGAADAPGIGAKSNASHTAAQARIAAAAGPRRRRAAASRPSFGATGLGASGPVLLPKPRAIRGRPPIPPIRRAAAPSASILSNWYKKRGSGPRAPRPWANRVKGRLKADASRRASGASDQRRSLRRCAGNPIYDPMSDFARAPLTAILGPTNTGKTHLAVERMAGHSSGMIGFPLRLLAREI